MPISTPFISPALDATVLSTSSAFKPLFTLFFILTIYFAIFSYLVHLKSRFLDHNSCCCGLGFTAVTTNYSRSAAQPTIYSVSETVHLLHDTSRTQHIGYLITLKTPWRLVLYPTLLLTAIASPRFTPVSSESRSGHWCSPFRPILEASTCVIISSIKVLNTKYHPPVPTCHCQ